MIGTHVIADQRAAALFYRDAQIYLSRGDIRNAIWSQEAAARVAMWARAGLMTIIGSPIKERGAEETKRALGRSWFCDRCTVEVYECRCPHCGKTKRERR